MTIRDFDPELDHAAAYRIFMEIGWIEKGKEEPLKRYLGAMRGQVALIDNEAECLVTTTGGSMRYLSEEIPMHVVTGVTTSRIARKMGFAARTAAKAIAGEVADGSCISALGMFEQGFYNRLGFGSGVYEPSFAFDPAHLNVPNITRPPKRIKASEFEQVHAARLNRKRYHGGCNIHSAEFSYSEMQEDGDFGLGFYDGPDGALSHHLWMSATKPEHGPYHVYWMSWETREQFLELMAVLKSLGDQVRLIVMHEPPTVQLQDLLNLPIKSRQITQKSEFESRMRGLAWWQMRITRLRECLEMTHLDRSVRFNLVLSDPIEKYLTEDSEWHGVGGNYVMELGNSSGCEPGTDDSLPTLKTTVNAFTRMWLGVRPASGLAITDELDAPEELLESLDHVFCLPAPRPDWSF